MKEASIIGMQKTKQVDKNILRKKKAVKIGNETIVY